LMGIRVVDEFDSLKAIERQGRDVFKSYYVMHGAQYGHLSARGNELIASLIASALKEPPPPGDAKAYTAGAFVPGSGTNLLPESERAKQMIAAHAFATLDRIDDSAGTANAFRLAATGGHSEHYVVVKPVAAGPGPYTLSLEAKSDGTSCLRLQVSDGKVNGVVSDVNLVTETAGSIPLGTGMSLSGGTTAIGDGWFRTWITVTTAAADPRVFLQLATPDCQTNF